MNDPCTTQSALPDLLRIYLEHDVAVVKNSDRNERTLTSVCQCMEHTVDTVTAVCAASEAV